jgi:ribosomal-protein-serine acetyltransferase
VAAVPDHAVISLDDGVELRPLGVGDGPLLFAAIEASREHLDRWLRWSPRIRSVADAAAFLEGFTGDPFHLGLFVDRALQGGVICWQIHPWHRSSEVGYWLAESAAGKGLATRAAGAVIDRLFREQDVHRIEMLTAEGNLRSRAVCERLGFRLESVRRGSHRFPGGFKDHLVYARLAGDVVPPDPPRRLLTDAEFRALLERLAAAWRARDYATAAACFAADVHYHDPLRYSFTGREALRAFFEADDGREQRIAWHTIVFDPARQAGVAEYTYEGTQRYHGAVVIGVARGEIASWREHQHVDARTWEEFSA